MADIIVVGAREDVMTRVERALSRRNGTMPKSERFRELAERYELQAVNSPRDEEFKLIAEALRFYAKRCERKSSR